MYTYYYMLMLIHFILCSHPKYRAALKEKLPFCVCGSTEELAPAKVAETTSNTTQA